MYVTKQDTGRLRTDRVPQLVHHEYKTMP